MAEKILPANKEKYKKAKGKKARKKCQSNGLTLLADKHRKGCTQRENSDKACSSTSSRMPA